MFKLIAENKTSKVIGAELFLSPRTVDTHRQNIAAKLELRGTRAVFQFAMEHSDGAVTPDAVLALSDLPSGGYCTVERLV